MKYLLDTHVWVWSVLTPERLKPRVAKALIAESSEVWVSPVSVWEILLLCERGRLSLDLAPAEWIQRSIEEASLREATVTCEVMLASAQVKLPHRDPVDRFLAATAKYYGLTLITADRALIEARQCKVLAA